MNKVEYIPKNELTKEQILELTQQLRQIVGLGLMDCKRFLHENNFDLQKSIEASKSYRYKVYI